MTSCTSTPRTALKWQRFVSVAAAAAVLTGCGAIASRAGSPAPPPAPSAEQGAYRLIQEPKQATHRSLASSARRVEHCA